MRLNGKTAIITGAGSGFGAGISQKFAQEGAQVMAADLSIDTAQQTAELVGGLAQHVDVSDNDSVEAMIAAAWAHWGPRALQCHHSQTSKTHPGKKNMSHITKCVSLCVFHRFRSNIAWPL